VGGEGKPLDWTTGQFLLLSTEGFSDSSGSARSRRNGSSVLLVIPRLRVPQQPHIKAPSVLMQNPTRRQLRRCERLHRKALDRFLDQCLERYSPFEVFIPEPHKFSEHTGQRI